MSNSELSKNGYKRPVKLHNKSEQEQIGEKILMLVSKGVPITEAADIVLGK